MVAASHFFLFWPVANKTEISSYSNAINCAMDYPDGDGQASTTDFEFVTGQFPSCFFNFPVIRGKLEDVGSSETQPSPPDDEPFINTSDRGNEYW